MGSVYRQKGRTTWLIKYYRDGRAVTESNRAWATFGSYSVWSMSAYAPTPSRTGNALVNQPTVLVVSVSRSASASHA